MNKNSRKKSKSNVTIVDVAREAGVSYSTVSRVFSGFEFINEDTRQKVMQAADRLGYTVNMTARSLAGGRSNVVGLLVPALDNGYIAEVARGIDEALAKANKDLMLYTTHRHQGRESQYVNTIVNGLCDGILLLVPLVPDVYLEKLMEKNYPYVLIDQSEPSGRSCVIESTSWQGAYEATKYLISLGHRRIGFITGLVAIHNSTDRLAGYKAALNDQGVPFDETLVREGDYFQPRGYEACNELLDLPSPPTAIFASNDLMAFGAMDAARERGLSIPDDISVVGFDDIPQASLVRPQLTTVHQPLAQMGRVAVQLLLEQLEEPDRPPRRITLATHLVERESCAPPNQP